jgi:hypothetical protein
MTLKGLWLLTFSFMHDALVHTLLYLLYVG